MKTLNRMFVSRAGEILAYMRKNPCKEVLGDVCHWCGHIREKALHFRTMPDPQPFDVSQHEYSAFCFLKKGPVEIWECNFPTPPAEEMPYVFPREMFILADEVEAITAGQAIRVLCRQPEVLRAMFREGADIAYQGLTECGTKSLIGRLEDYADYLCDDPTPEDRRGAAEEMITPEQRAKDALFGGAVRAFLEINTEQKGIEHA